MRVVDIPSSPGPGSSTMARRTRSARNQPGPSRKRPRLAPAREPSIMEVIELTDSDDDLPACRSSKQSHLQQETLHPAPANIPNAVVTFGKPHPGMLADTPALASGPSQRAGKGDDEPLFFPGSGDERRVVYLPVDPTARKVPDAAPAHPQLPLEPAAPKPAVPVDPDHVGRYLARVLEIVPDAQPTYAATLIEQFTLLQPDNVVELVLHALFENPSYPKADQKGKHRREEPDDDPNARGSPKPKVDYISKERVYNCDPYYFERSLEQLMMDFPRIPKPYLRSRLLSNRFYAPTYLLLAEELKREPLPFKLKSISSVVPKGKIRENPEFDKEREWVLLRAVELATAQDAALAASVNEKEYEDNNEGIECGCCFSEYPFDQMIQCPEAHLFCKTCMTSYASNLLGEHNPNIVCMDQSGCKLPFPESELCRFLSSKLLGLYYRVKQRKEIEAAGLENLEECPFCEYKCVIENNTEKLFRCENTECSAITCRMCKKPDHLPKTCEEVKEDKQLDAQHVIEEAMTQALMRNCPKCQKSFIKEMGCNKMTCPNCHTVSCYICRKVINGYEHFSNPPPYSGKADNSKCNLWDPVEKRHAEEVSEAAKRALAELRKSHPDVDAANLKLDIPVAQAPPPPGPAQAYAGPGLDGGGVALPAYMGRVARGGPAGIAGPGVGLRVGGVAAGVGVGVGGAGGMGMPPLMGPRPGFLFGAGQAHQFQPPPLYAQRLYGMVPEAQGWGQVQGQGRGQAPMREAMVAAGPAQAHEYAPRAFRGQALLAMLPGAHVQGQGQPVREVWEPAVPPPQLAYGLRARPRPAPALVPMPMPMPAPGPGPVRTRAQAAAVAEAGGRRRRGR